MRITTLAVLAIVGGLAYKALNARRIDGAIDALIRDNQDLFAPSPLSTIPIPSLAPHRDPEPTPPTAFNF